MRKKTPPIFYSNQVDEDGRPRKHIRVPDDFIQYLDDRMDYKIEEALKHCGLPTGSPDAELKRTELFIFLRHVKGAWDILIKRILVVAGTIIAGWIFYKNV